MGEIRSRWQGFSSILGVVTLVILLVSAFVSAERSLKDEEPKKIETLDEVESDYLLKVVNFLWKADGSGYQHVWHVRISSQLPCHLVVMVNVFLAALKIGDMLRSNFCIDIRRSFWCIVLSVVKRRPELQKVSFVAHSLGGLVARYAIGKLYSSNPKHNPSEGNGDCSRDGSGSACLEKKSIV